MSFKINFFEEIKDNKLRVVFIGIGVSNTDTIEFFAKKGIDVSAYDKKSRDLFDENTIDTLEESGAKLFFGDYDISKMDADIIFRTPGMYFASQELNEFREKGGILTSELEVFFQLCPCKTIAVTGSDGKTTTSTIISQMLKAQGHTVHLGGNIGRALLPIVEQINPNDFVVAELSSFQLMSMRPSPDIAVVTNISPNHLDVHGTMGEYISCKQNILSHQTAFSRSVINSDDDISVSDFMPLVRGILSQFSLCKSVYDGAYLENNTIVKVDKGLSTKIFEKTEIKLPGIHNIANFLAAISAVKNYVSDENIKKIAKSFTGVEHRMEFVREINSVSWYNDSIASSPSRTSAGLRTFDKKIILIAGGYDKKIPYESLAFDIIEHVKVLILCGDTSEKIEKAVTSHHNYKNSSLHIVKTFDIPSAVKTAQKIALSGDIVALSPASASFDFYANFEERGKHFKDIVNKLS